MYGQRRSIQYLPSSVDVLRVENNGVLHIAPVGVTSSGRAKWGHFDLAGELEEWTLDAQSAYRPCTDCAFLSVTAPGRSTRGGDFVNPISLIHPWYRTQSGPTGRNSIDGFRCARVP